MAGYPPALCVIRGSPRKGDKRKRFDAAWRDFSLIDGKILPGKKKTIYLISRCNGVDMSVTKK